MEHQNNAGLVAQNSQFQPVVVRAQEKNYVFSEEFRHIFASGGLNVYDSELVFQDFMYIMDEDKPEALFQSINLKYISIYLIIFLDGIKYF